MIPYTPDRKRACPLAARQRLPRCAARAGIAHFLPSDSCRSDDFRLLLVREAVFDPVGLVMGSVDLNPHRLPVLRPSPEPEMECLRQADVYTRELAHDPYGEEPHGSARTASSASA